jgi:hypothetical protein
LNSDGITRRGMMRGSSRPVITCDCMQSTFFLVTPLGEFGFPPSRVLLLFVPSHFVNLHILMHRRNRDLCNSLSCC